MLRGLGSLSGQTRPTVATLRWRSLSKGFGGGFKLMLLTSPSLLLLFNKTSKQNLNPSTRITLSITPTVLRNKRLYFYNQPEQHAALIASNLSSYSTSLNTGDTLKDALIAALQTVWLQTVKDEHQAVQTYLQHHHHTNSVYVVLTKDGKSL